MWKVSWEVEVEEEEGKKSSCIYAIEVNNDNWRLALLEVAHPTLIKWIVVREGGKRKEKKGKKVIPNARSGQIGIFILKTARRDA